MTRIILRSILFLSFLIFQHNSYAKKLRVLFLGNSYTAVNNLPELVKQVAQSAGDTLDYMASTPGGTTLQNHVNNPATINLINSIAWDYVILQEQSQLPSFPDATVATDVYPYAQQLNAIIKQNNPCTKTLFYMTWGRKNGDISNCPFFPPLCTYEGMDSLLQLRYTKMAEQNNASISPVAVVWRKLRINYPAIELYSSDESHPSESGSYAAACTFYAALFEKDPTLSTYNYSIPAADATIIRNIAKNIVFDSLSFWSRYEVKPMADFQFTLTGATATFTNLSTNANAYLWEFGDGTTSVEMAPNHTYTTNGAYEVRLTSTDSICGTRDTLSHSITMSGLSLPDVSKNAKWEIYPNPVLKNGTLTLSMMKSAELELLDAIGTKVYSVRFSAGINTLKLDGLAAGVYWISVEGFSKKIVILRD